VAPGSSAEIQVVIQNHGVEADSFQLSIEGIPSNWISTSSPVIRLEPGASKTVGLKIMPPLNPHSRAGRHTFAIKVVSQSEPSQIAEIECALSVAAYSDFAVSLTPVQTEPQDSVHLSLQNRGNIHQTYSTTFQSLGDRLAFEPVQQTIGGVPVAWPASPGPLNGPDTVTIQIPAGETAELIFRARPHQPIWVGGTHTDNYRMTVRSADRTSQSVEGLVVSRAVLPVWVLAVGISLCLVLALFSLFLLYQSQRGTTLALETAQFANAATQTAVAEQTAVALLGSQDGDGDGLSTADELQRGTDPTLPDTDVDRLNDGEEVSQGTDPLNPDSDQDGLLDGDELLTHHTHPLNPDSDGDQLVDGDEIQRGLDPLNVDTDQDNLRDGDEILLGTDPLKQDTDGDRLLDGDEHLPCPDPRNPDSDGDGVIDSLDLDPCNPGNPSLTATAAGQIPPSVTPVPPTAVPTEAPGVTAPAPPAPQALPGLMVFESNREGNPQLYTSSDPVGGTANRLVTSAGVDTQPDWSPNGNLVAFTSNLDGNNEIYLLNADGSGLQRLTNDPANDQFPSWSPDGEWIAFTSDRNGNQEIYKIRVDGSELQNLSNNPANDYQPDWYEHPEFLGLTEEILFTTDRDGNHEIYVMQADGSEQTNLTNHPSNDGFPAGTSIGNRIAFSSDRQVNQEIFVMDRNGENLVNLTGHPANEFDPTWSPDGLWVGYVSDRDGNQEIYVLSTLDGGQFNFSRNAAQDLYPAWK
jgi:Tol biopolymer transport system component